MQFIFLIQARLGSTRLPFKTLTLIDGETTLLELVYRRVLEAKEATLDNVYVLTSDSPKDDQLVSFMKERGIRHGRGSEQNVFGRFYNFLKSHFSKPDYIIRVCCDNPFLEPKFIDEITEFLKNNKESKYEYLSHADIEGRPAMATHYGFFCEAISLDAFMRANDMDLSDVEKEHVTPQFYKSGKFSTKFIPMPQDLEVRPYRFTVDTPDDLHVARTVSADLPKKFSYKEVLSVAEKYSDLLDMMATTIAGDKKSGR